MVVVQAVQKWKHYLMCGHFIIVTDQKSLSFLTEQHLLIEVQFKWASKLIGFDFQIQYKPKKENKAADELDPKEIFSAMSILQPDEWKGWEHKNSKEWQINFFNTGLITRV